MDTYDPCKTVPVRQNIPGVELVAEEDLDFENFKKRAEFREEFGGDGELYGRPDDLISRPGTPSTMATMTDVGLFDRRKAVGGSDASTRASSITRHGVEDELEQGISYEPGYQRTPMRDTFNEVEVSIPATPLDAEEVLQAGRGIREDSYGRLLQDERDVDNEYFGRSFGQHEDTSYDQYRRPV